MEDRMGRTASDNRITLVADTWSGGTVRETEATATHVMTDTELKGDTVMRLGEIVQCRAHAMTRLAVSSVEEDNLLNPIEQVPTSMQAAEAQDGPNIVDKEQVPGQEKWRVKAMDVPIVQEQHHGMYARQEEQEDTDSAHEELFGRSGDGDGNDTEE